MKFQNILFAKLLMSLLLQSVRSQDYGGEPQNPNYQIDIQDQLTIGIGCWITYRPLRFDKIPVNPEMNEVSNEKRLFLFSFQKAESNIVSLLIFVDLSLEDEKITHNLILQTLNGIQYLTLIIDYQTYEGTWFFIYCYIDQIEQAVSFNSYNYNTQSLLQQVFYGQLQIFDKMKIITGGYENVVIDGINFNFLTFPGYIKAVIVRFENFFLNNIESFIWESQPEYPCREFNQYLVPYNSYMNDKLIKKEFEIFSSNYIIQGWIKQDKLTNQKQLETVLLRISKNQNYLNDNSQEGDQILLVTYFQNQEDLSQNGFSLQTYRYIDPWKSDTYIQDEYDIIVYKDLKYLDLLTQWHYFLLEMRGGQGQPLYKVYYSGTDSIEVYTWQKKINHFTLQKLFLSIGGDDYSQIPFQGYLSDWIFTQLCSSEEISIVVKCHYTCQTCKGISERDCTSCNEQNNRIYNEFSNTCQCKYGYLDQYQGICIQLPENLASPRIYERQIVLTDYAFYQNQCNFGYFQFNNTCIECPYKTQQNLIRCADCIIYPDVFSEKLVCTFQFNSTDELSVFNYYELGANESEFYSIQLNIDQEYFLKKMVGYLNNFSCKVGYFLTETGICQECMNHCLKCKNSQTCYECQQRYNYINNYCVYCENCTIIDFGQTDDGVYWLQSCPKRMYFRDEFCYNCGAFCIECQSSFCQQCEDSSKYFITLDSINCAECSIQFCIYCFQYYVKSDQSIMTSLDIQDQIEGTEHQIITGCALCQDNYFYSFVSLQCEPKPLDMIDCQSGVLKIDSNNFQCLVSKDRSDAIQQSICDDTKCLSCINNYSKHIKQFCIICKDGYYSSFFIGQCKKCPSNCLTCAEFNIKFQDLWKWKIRAFYQYFINQHYNHYFEDHQSTVDVKIICLSCNNNLSLINYSCVSECNEDCLDCQVHQDKFSANVYQCNKCKPQTYNLQRSVVPETISKCLACPDYCSACYQRTPEQISKINPFFKIKSNFLQYTHICYQAELINQEANVSINPIYLVPSICHDFSYCEKIYEILYYFFCDITSLNESTQQETNYILQNRYQQFQLEIIKKLIEYNFFEEQLKLLNQARVKEFQYIVDIVYHQGNTFCNYYDNNQIIIHAQEDVFTLNYLILTFRNSQKSTVNKVSLSFTTQSSIINFNKVTYEAIEFHLCDEQNDEAIVNLTFYNDYYPITISFENCIIVQTYWGKYSQLNFFSKVAEKLLITQMNLETLQIINSFLFYFQNSKFQIRGSQQIELLIINNSNFTNTSIFMYNADQYSQNQILTFSNVIISNSNFSSSFFINSSLLFDYSIGEINLENFHIENVVLTDNSGIFQIFSATKINAKNISINNLVFLDSSSFIVCNTLNISFLSISNSFINQGQFINIQQYTSFQSQQIIQKDIILSQINFINNTYSDKSMKSFMNVLQNSQTKYNVICINFLLDNNVLFKSKLGKLSFIDVTYKYSLIYIECNKCLFKDLIIYRGIGLPEISIINSQQLEINNLYIETKEQYYKRSLHSSVECSKKLIYLDIPFVLFIQSYKNVQIENIFVQNTMIINYQLIALLGESTTQSIQYETISISNSIFKNNLLLIVSENKQSSIISIETQQISFITIRNIQFHNNYINQYYLNSIQHSSTTLLINARNGQLILQLSLFKNNVISNSTDSVLYALANHVVIIDSDFLNQNIPAFQVFEKNLIFLENSIIYDSDIYGIFLILSSGGSGYIQTAFLSIKNTSITNSLAINGEGYYISTMVDGFIEINNCSFFNTSTILNSNSLASGGLIYIDSSQSILNLSISNSVIQSAYARTYGGAIYIEPSRTYNLIQLKSLVIESVFSIQHSFLSFSPKKLITISSEIIISNIKVSNSVKQFEGFVMQLADLQEQNILVFQADNPLIYNLNLRILIWHILEISQGNDIFFDKIIAMNNSVLQSPVFKVSLRSDIKCVMRMKNLQIKHLKEVSQYQVFQCDLTPIIYQEFLCPLVFSESTINPKIINYDYNLDKKINCNLNSLLQIRINQTFSIIEINELNENHFLFIDDLTISEVNCSNCKYGIFNIKEFKSELKLSIKNIKLINNICGILGCLSIVKSMNDITILQTTQAKQQVKLTIEKIIFHAKIDDSIFQNNTAQYGGACFLSQIDIFINNTRFKNNKAEFYGGSIYYISDSTNLLIQNSQIVKNQAQIGGGLYFQNYQIQNINKLNLVIQENQGFNFANNLYETPRFLYLSLDRKTIFNNIQLFRNSTTIIEQVQINPYQIYQSKNLTDILLLPSGISVQNYNYFNFETNSYISFNQSLRLQTRNAFDERITNLENTECQIQAQIINTSLTLAFDDFRINNSQINKLISSSNIIFNIVTGDYNLDDLIIYFNPFQNKQLQLQLVFQCNSIEIPFHNTSTHQLSNIITNYILLLNLRTFECQLGEYFNQTTGGCMLCDIAQSQYSVKLNSTYCSYKDETKIQDIEPAIIQLKPSYWRAFYYSEKIEECHNLLANCEGGWLAGNPSCAQGHIGALCEQCDLYNTKGQGQYSQNQSYQCSNCDQSATQILNIALVILWTLVSVFITVTSTIQMIDDQVFQQKLRPLGFYAAVSKASTSVLLKIFTNYLQIVSSIGSFQLQIPLGITLAIRGVGNPIGSVAFSLDCYLKDVSRIPIIYLRIIWGLAIVGMYIFIFFLFHILTIALKKTKFQITFVTTTLIYIYIYLSPNIISDLSSLISFRNISEEQWIAANVAFLYNTQNHKDWLLYFITPTFFVIGILLPFFFWYIVYHHRNHLNKTNTRRIWGYLYNEYKFTTYYWETIKIIQKELIILILIYYEDYVAIKACLIFFLLYFYSKLSQRFKPYLTDNLNKIDSLSTQICNLSIILAHSIYLAQILNIKELIWSFYVVLGIINFYFVFQMVSKLVFAYFDKLHEQIDNVKDMIIHYIPYRMRKNKLCIRILSNTTKKKQLIRYRFQKLRKYLFSQAKLIIEFKKINNMGLLCNQDNKTTRNLSSNQKCNIIFKVSPHYKILETQAF